MNRVLFVDDEVNVLEALRRMLHGKRSEWHMEFAAGGAQALDLLATQPFDLIVTDMRMPGVDGAKLLAEVARLYPKMIRIILSGQTDQEALMRSICSTHQYVAKPCDAETLIDVLTRACRLQGVSANLLGDEKLKALVSNTGSLPSLPLLYAQLLQECQSANGSIGKVAQIISQDVAMTAKVLQLLNSAFFGFRRTVSSPLQAVQLLGLDTIKALVLWSEVFSRFNHTRLKGFSMSALWAHSIATSSVARQIAAAEGADRLVVDDAGVAGLLHDSGRLVLATNLPEQFEQAKALARDQRIPLWAAERDVFGETHAAVGAYLLALWAIPDSIVEAVAFHHTPLNADTRAFGALAAVHVANALVEERAEQATMPGQADVAYLTELGLTERLDLWRQTCQVPEVSAQ